MKVLILTEGSRNIGFGHVTRCTSLYQAFEKRGILPEFIVNGDETVEDLLIDKNYKVFNWLEKQEKLFSIIKIADVVIVDSYLAGYDVCKRISDTVKIPVYIDDNKRIDYPDGIIINGTAHAEEMGYPEKDGITYLLGSQYMPVRKEFWDVQKKVIKENLESIMITFGGMDPRNMTIKTLKLLTKYHRELTKQVVIGKGYKAVEQIESLKNEKTEFIYHPYADEMKKIMLKSDIAISAGGQTLYELARVGVPTIAVGVSDNQLNNIKGLQKAGFAENAGWW